MKTFKEFLEESTREDILARMASARKTRMASARTRRSAFLERLRQGRTGADILTNLKGISGGSSSSKKRAAIKRRNTIKDLRQFYPITAYIDANKKLEKLNDEGLEGHHTTPLHYSERLKASMSPDEWNKRVSTDAESGIFHGHHPRNLMGTVVDETPESRRKTGILHRKGTDGFVGAHDLEAKTRDLTAARGISHLDLIAAAQRMTLRRKAKARKLIARMDNAATRNAREITRSQLSQATTAKDIDKILNNN